LFGILCLVILLRSVYHIAARSFYAQQDTRTPLLISLVSIAISVGLELWFVFGLHAGAVGIAWTQVIWASLEVIALFILMARRIPNLFNRHFWSGIGRMVFATAVMSIATYALVKLIGLEFADQTMLMVLPQLAVIGLGSMMVYVGLSKLLRLDEAVPVLNYLKKIILGKLWVGRR
jgi:putative peptidoglycan lipid II flippase